MFVYVSMMLWTAICGFLSKGSETEYIIEGKIVKRIHGFFAALIMGYIIIVMGTFYGTFDLPVYQAGYEGLVPDDISLIPTFVKDGGKYPGFNFLQVFFLHILQTKDQPKTK